MGLFKSSGRHRAAIKSLTSERNAALFEAVELRSLASELTARVEAEAASHSAHVANLQSEISRLRSELGLWKNRLGDWRVVKFCGHDMVVYGRLGDPYFETVGSGNEDDFFSYVIAGIRKDGICFDVGANIGLTSTALSRAAESVHSFEPSEAAFRYLSRTLMANSCHNVITNNVAVSSAVGNLTFHDNATSYSASHIVTDGTMHQTNGYGVEATTIDAYASKMSIDRVDFIKIDIEGHEAAAIAGASDVITSLKPVALVEFNPFTLMAFGNTDPREFLSNFCSTFPYVYRWNSGTISAIQSDGDVLSLLHDTLVGPGCVTDIYGTFRPL